MSAMMLINALIVHADSLDFKIHLRSEFHRCGLTKIIEKLKKKPELLDEQFAKQITIFENYAKANFEDLEAHYENIDIMWDGN